MILASFSAQSGFIYYFKPHSIRETAKLQHLSLKGVLHQIFFNSRHLFLMFKEEEEEKLQY
jgi:hypothetical protein